MATLNAIRRQHLLKQRAIKDIKPKEPQNETFSYVPKKKKTKK